MNHPNDPKRINGDAKTPLHLLPPYALAQIALAHREGAERYGAWNWRETGVCATTYIGAIMRHLAAWQDGEDNDPDSGLSHIAKIGACCNILLDAEHCGKLVDDRSKVGESFKFQDCITKGASGNVLVKKLSEMKEATVDDLREFIRGCRDVDALLEIASSSTLPDGLPPLPPVPEGQYRRKIQKVTFAEVLNEAASKINFNPMGPTLHAFNHFPNAIPDGLPPLPPVPEGYDRWEYRGMGWSACSDFTTFASQEGQDPWVVRLNAFMLKSNENRHYIEAVKDALPDTPRPMPPLPPDTPGPLTPERFDTSQLTPPAPPLSKLPEGYSKWKYRGKGWTCNGRKTPPYFYNVGIADPQAPISSAEDVKWSGGNYKQDWPEGMGWYYEAVR